MLKKTISYCVLGVFGLMALSKEVAHAADYIAELRAYKRADLVPGGKRLLEGKDLRTFHNFPSAELEWFSDTDIPALVDESLTEADIRSRLERHTVYALTCKKVPYSMYFTPGHTVILLMADGRVEEGNWWVDDSGVHAQWSKNIHKGESTTVVYHGVKDKPDYLIFKMPQKQQYAVSYVRSGDAENLVERLRNTPN